MNRFFPEISFVLLHRRILLCFLLSSIGHLCFLLVLFVWITPPEGHPEGKPIQVVLNTGATTEKEESVSETFTSPEEPARDLQEETDWASEESANETLEDIQSLLQTTDEGEAKEYLEKQRKKALAQKQNKHALKEVQEKISRGIDERSKYGTLEPRTFYGIAVVSKKILFVIDVSGSMDILHPTIQVENVLKSLLKNEYFNILLYAREVLAWKSKLIPATPENQAEAIKWMEGHKKKKLGHATDIHKALQKALEVATAGERADVIYFVSDGKPMVGVEAPEKILRDVREWNLSKRIVIHTIGIGLHQDDKFLKSLAEQNYGSYFER